MESNSIIDKPKVLFNENSVEFYEAKDICFPNICIICGKETKKKFKKSIKGTVNSVESQYKIHHFDLPICNKCQNFLKIDFNPSSKVLITSTVVGCIASILIGIFTYSILFAIVLASLSFLIPYFNYRIKKKNKLRIENFIKFQIVNNDKKIIITFINENYAEYVMKVNSKDTENTLDNTLKKHNSYK